MRITIDLDSHSKFLLGLTLVRGIATLYRLPNEIRKTNRGRHLIYRGIKCSEEEMFIYRHIIGDDERRIMMDKIKKKGERQILFKEKNVSFFALDDDGNRYLINKINHPNIDKEVNV